MSAERPADHFEVDAARGWRMIVRRFAALSVGEGATLVLGFVVMLLLARRLGPSGFGVVTLGLTLVAWFMYVVDSGTEILNVREVARRPDRFRPIAEQMMGLRLALSVLATALFVAGVGLFTRTDFTRSTLLLFALMLPASALNLRWMVLGIGGSRAIAIGQTLSRLIVLAGVVLFVASLDDIKRVPLLEATGALMYGLVILWLVSRGARPLRPRADLMIWRTTLTSSLPLMCTGLARAAIISFDVLVIDLVLGPGSVGVYAVASKPAFVMASLVGLFSMAFLSAFSATAAGDARALQRRALRWAVGVGVLVAVALSAASVLLPWVFGEAYDEAVPVLAVVAWRIPVAAIAGLYASTLIARDRQTDVMWNSIIVGAFVVVADVAAVLAFGIMGAAVVSVLGAVMSAWLYARSVRRIEPDLATGRLGSSGRSIEP